VRQRKSLRLLHSVWNVIKKDTNFIIVEVKAVSSLAGEHVSQLLNYMHITESKVGYLVNYGNKDKFEWKRLVL
jgi:GxxExxY protein